MSSTFSGSENERARLIPASRETQTHQTTKAHNIRNFAWQAWRLVSGILFRWPAAAVVAVFMRIDDIWDSHTINKGKMQVNTFYFTAIAGTREERAVFNALPLIGMLFGAIHCAGWNFLFPSIAEANIWRVSSAFITGVPAIGLVGFLLDQLHDYYDDKNFWVAPLGYLVAGLVFVTLPFYVLARVALLVEALISLRDLPHGALAVVEWISFLPHV